MLALIAASLGASPGGPPPVLQGSPAPEGRWPDAVAVFNDSGFTCTGTLIAPDLVLTAGHCMALVQRVVVGATDHTVDGESIDVAEAISHPDPFALYDVGLLRLASPASAPPRGLVTDCAADFVVDGAIATVVGFGRTDPAGQQGTTRLMEAEVPLVDADCSDLSRGCRSLVSPGGELVAGGDGVDSCTGDSGGPLYLPVGDQTFVAGVVSRGAYPAASPCGDGGIYVRTDAIVDWIESAAGVTLARPDCAGVNRPPQVSAEVLRVTQGRSAALPVVATDPEGGPLTVAVLEGPERGTVSDDLVFRAEPFQVGPDRVVVAYTDAGEPPRTVAVAVDIAVSPAGHLDDPIGTLPRGCSTAPGSSPWALWGLVVLFFGRPPASRGRPPCAHRPSGG